MAAAESGLRDVTLGVVRRVGELRLQVAAARTAGKRIGFVPTMGAPHPGHLALADAARRAADFVVASIFVNPTQFGPREDFDSYPRDESADLAVLARAGVDLAYLPSVLDIYAPGDATRVTAAARIAAGADPDACADDAKGALLAAGFAPIDYFELRDATTLARAVAPPARLFAAAYLGGVRLIDYIAVG